MDNMDGMGMTSLASGQMLPYLHATPGDILWFEGWVPKGAGAMVGACIGLFLLAIFERWLAACRGVAERSWAHSAGVLREERLSTAANKLPTSSDPSDPPMKPPAPRPDMKHSPSSLSPRLPSLLRSPPSTTSKTHTLPPFILSHDLARGIVHAAQTALGFAMMLVVMTFQIGFILAMVVGLGVGETLFGRFANHAAHL